MKEYIHISVIIEELDRLVRTKQIDMVHTNLESIEQNLLRENENFPHEADVMPKTEIEEIIKKIISLQFWSADPDEYIKAVNRYLKSKKLDFPV